jgi:WD40 repeat protein/uncharacterized protein YciI
MLRVLTGDETGLLKLVELKKKQVASKWGRQSRKNGVARMAWAPSAEGRNTVASVSPAGVVELWDPVAGAHLGSVKNAGADCVYLAAHGENLLTCTKTGTVRLFNPGCKDADAHSAQTFEVGGRVSTARLAPGGSGLLALGGRDHDLQLWDVATGKQVFQAANVGRDWLDRVVPVWVAALSFVPTGMRSKLTHGDFSQAVTGRSQSAFADVGVLVTEEEAAGWAQVAGGSSSASASSSGAAGKAADKTAAGGKGRGAAPTALPASEPDFEGPDCIVAVCTGHKHVRLYDTRAQAPPVLNVDMGEAPFTACAASVDGRYLLTGDTLGNVRRLDTRMMRQNGGYHGAAGSVRDLAVHPGGKPYLAVTGLDRFLRVFHLENRDQVRAVYLKQRQNALLWDASPAAGVGAGDGGAKGRGRKGRKGAAEEGEDKLVALREADLDDDFDDGEGGAVGEEDEEGEDELRAEERAPHRLQITNFPKADRLFPVGPDSESDDGDGDSDEDGDEEGEEESGEDGGATAGMDEDEAAAAAAFSDSDAASQASLPSDEDEGLSDADEEGAAAAEGAGAAAGAAGRAGAAVSRKAGKAASAAVPTKAPGTKSSATAAAGAGRKAAGAAATGKAGVDEDEEELTADDSDGEEGGEGGSDEDEDSLLDFGEDDEDDEDGEGEAGDGSDDAASADDDDKPSGGRGGRGGRGGGRAPPAKRGRHSAGRGGAGAGAAAAAADADGVFLGEGRKAADMRKALKVERKRMEKLGPGARGGSKGAAAGKRGGKR